MSTYKTSFKSYQNQGLGIHYKQNKSQTIIKVGRLMPCSYPQSQTGLYIDISLRQSASKSQNWSSFEYYLKELFDQIIELEKYPNSMVKINIFVLENEKNIKATIINGLWILLLKMGINMKKSIYCWQDINQKTVSGLQNNLMQIQSENTQKNYQHRAIYDLNNMESIIQGEAHYQQYKQQFSKEIQSQIKQYKQYVLETIRENLFL